MKEQKTEVKVVKMNCGNGGGCAIQPYILPYCGIQLTKFAKR